MPLREADYKGGIIPRFGVKHYISITERSTLEKNATGKGARNPKVYKK